MTRPLNDSPYLYGLHDPGGEQIMAQQGVFGWILFTEEVGRDPNATRGGDYSRWADQGFGIMVRLNHGYEPDGTLPRAIFYADFAKRCANFVRNSRGCHIWIIGNEMNYAVERPGVCIDWSQSPPRLVEAGEIILPGLYVNCYRRCREAIKGVPGHENDQVIVGAPAPWNDQTKYDGNPTGDWVKYLTDALTLLGPKGCDGISIHAYTHGADPKQIYTDALMNPPFQNRQYNFRCYQDFMAAIPTGMRSLPVYLTEADQNDEWRDENNGWVQRVYGEIDWWNRQPGNQKIRALILYRWPKGLDKWGIEGKAGVIEDFRQAMRFNYRWEAAAAEPIQPVQPPQPTVPVQPPQPVVDTSPISFPQTGHATSGSFAAFHRQYGLDITGYPISEIYVSPESGLKTQDWQRLIMEEFPAGAIRLRLAGTQLAELRARIGQLEQEIGRLKAGAGGPAEPPISDISSQLPRKPEGLVKRPVSEIKYIVINHTGVRPDVGADRVAQAQLARFPGIVGQYFITGAGQIQQTHPDDEVVARDQGWIYNGLNVYVAGNFDAAVPGADQLDALAQLCAWLLAKYNLPEDALKGVSEFITTHSPGLQWLNGQRWKDTLLQRVRAIPAQPAGPTPQPTEDVTALRAQLAELQARAQQLQAQVDDLQARNAELQVQLEAARKGTGGAKVAPPAITDITVQLPRNADSLKSRPAGQIRFLVFNHTAVDPSVGVERIAAAHQKRWGAILYQYCITADGTILQTNALDQVVDLSQPWIAEGVNVALAGNFTAEIPNDKQLAAAAQLSAWLMQTYQIPVENVKGVSEFVNSQSPGKQWLEGRKYKDLLLARVDELLRAAGPAPKPADAAIIATLRTEIGRLQTALGQAQTQVAALTQERDQLKAQVGKPSATETQLGQQVQALTKQMQALTADKTTLAGQVQALSNDKTSLSQQVQALNNEKTSLTSQVQALAADKANLTRQTQTLSAEKTALSGQVQALTNDKSALTQQLATAAQEKATLNTRINDLLQQIKALQSGGGSVVSAGPQLVPAPAIQDITDQLARHSTLKYATRTLDKITHLTIHHSAAPANVTPAQVANYHVNNVGWPGIGYHFYVEPDGTIYQVNRLETISYHAGNCNSYTVGICASGTFSKGIIPTPRQIEQTGHLAAWLVQKLNLKVENVMGHKEFPDNLTECPGDDWLAGKQWKQLLAGRLKDVLGGSLTPPARTIGHYLLFWQRPDVWAREDWAAALNYIARFRPTTGFLADDARNAEYVTIVGGPGGVSPETEQALVAAGCKVERLAGADYADTKRMLDELAQTGRRFRTFNV